MRPNDIYTVDDLVDNLRECAKDWLYCGGSEALEEQFELASEAIRERVTDFEAKVIALQKELDELKEQYRWHNLKVGDILCWKWQHLKDETTWYQVIEVASEEVYVREIKSSIVNGSHMLGESIPSRDDFVNDEVLIRTVMPNSIKINSCQNAYLWDGKPKHHDYYS